MAELGRRRPSAGLVVEVPTGGGRRLHHGRPGRWGAAAAQKMRRESRETRESGRDETVRVIWRLGFTLGRGRRGLDLKARGTGWAEERNALGPGLKG